MEYLRQMQMSIWQQKKEALVEEAKRTLSRGGTINYEFAREALGFSPRFATRQNLNETDEKIIIEIFLRFEVYPKIAGRENDGKKHPDTIMEEIAKDLKLKNGTRPKQLHSLLLDQITAFATGAEYNEFDQEVSKLRNLEDNRYVEIDGMTIMVCKHSKERCAACKTDLTTGNQWSIAGRNKKELKDKLKNDNAENPTLLAALEEDDFLLESEDPKKRDWKKYLAGLDEAWKKSAANLFEKGEMTTAQIAKQLKLTEKQVKNFKRKYNAQWKAIFGDEENPDAHGGSADDAADTEKISQVDSQTKTGAINDDDDDDSSPVEKLTRKPFISSLTNLGKYVRDFPCKSLPATFLSQEAVEQISVQRHKEEETIYECLSREMGCGCKLDDDIIKDALHACRVADNALLYVMLEEVFGTIIKSVEEPSKDAEFEKLGKEGEALRSYYFGVASFFDALYVQEEAVRKKQLFLKSAKFLGKAIVDFSTDKNFGRRLRALWFLYRLLRLIIHNGNLDKYLTDMKKQLKTQLSSVSGNTDHKASHQIRLVNLHFTLYFAKIKFESHLRSDALKLFLEAETELNKILEEVESNPKLREHKLILPGGNSDKRMKKLVPGQSINLKKVEQTNTNNYACTRDILNLHLGVLYRENKDFVQSMQYFNALEASLNNQIPVLKNNPKGKAAGTMISVGKFQAADVILVNHGSDAFEQHVGLKAAYAAMSQRSWKPEADMPDFFTNHPAALGLEHAYIQERFSNFLAYDAAGGNGGKEWASHWIDHYPWAKYCCNPRLRRTYLKLSSSPNSLLEKVDPGFHRCFQIANEDSDGDLEKLLEKLETEKNADDEQEPRKVNPLHHEGAARLYYEILAEDALRRKNYKECIDYSERKLNVLAGLWDRSSVYHILKACLDMADELCDDKTKGEAATANFPDGIKSREDALALGQQKLAHLRKEFKAQMLYHEYFFVLYLENELTCCSEESRDRVLLRVNKFRKQFPKMVALCNVKQSRDYYDRYCKEKSNGASGKATKSFAMALELAKRATRYLEGRLWLAFLQRSEHSGKEGSTKSNQSMLAEMLGDADQLDLIDIVVAADDSPRDDDSIDRTTNEENYMDIDELVESFCREFDQHPERLKQKLDIFVLFLGF